MRIVTPRDFPFPWFNLLPFQTRPEGNPGTKTKRKYKDIVTAFDIETTRIEEIEQSVMYVWQWAFGCEYCVVGRTWAEFLEFHAELTRWLKPDEYIVCFDHNLSFEFMFLRGIWRFESSDVFAVKSRKILKCVMGQVEFRCSYLHSNMSLSEYLDRMKVRHRKLSGDEFDYSKRRFSWTSLTEKELEYCCNDVIGLVEAVSAEMAHDGDNLYTIPLTSTGYVRRDIKQAMRRYSKSFILDQFPSLEIYTEIREAFRGGDCHANRYYTGQIVTESDSADRSSSYPDIVCNNEFPVSEFFQVKGPMSEDEVLRLIWVRHKALIMRVAISGIELKDPFYPAPYLSRDKCRNIINPIGQLDYYDNGRVLQAEYLETTITDVDFRLLLHEYKWKDIIFYDVAYARYGKLPEPIVSETIRYYKLKTELKTAPRGRVETPDEKEKREMLYMKSKNKLNSIYGMFAQDIAKKSLLYIQDGQINKERPGQIDYFIEDQSKTTEDILDKAKRVAFAAYQWCAWVTAWARYRLHEAIWLILEQGAEFLYCDTDSVKYIGNVSFDNYNKERIESSKQSGAFATDLSGKVHYMGVFEQEAHMLEFRTLGAKKYVYRTADGKLHCTVAGVGKKDGARQLERCGGVSAFRTGFVFGPPAGGLEAVYNDAPAVSQFSVDGHTVEITSNVTLRPSSYTLGVGEDYNRLLKNRIYDIDF